MKNKILQSLGSVLYFQNLGKRKRTKMDVEKTMKIKKHVFINLKFMLISANSLQQVMSHTDKKDTISS